MANYATLKAAIQAVIYENGNQEITGEVMQATLLSMVNSLGANFQYAGIATPTTNPGTPDQNVFYLAATAGTYVNFGNIVLGENEVAVLKYNGAWVKDSTGLASAEKVNQLSQKLYFKDSINLSEYPGKSTYPSDANYTTTSGSTRAKYVPVTPGEMLMLETQNQTRYCVLKTYSSPASGDPVDYAEGYTGNVALEAGGMVILTIPEDGHYLCVFTRITITDTYVTVDRVKWVTDSVKDLQTNLQTILYPKLSVPFNVTGWVSRLTGVVTKSDKSLTTELIQIEENATYKICGVFGDSAALVVFYDEDREYLGYLDEAGLTSPAYVSISKKDGSIPSGASYMRVQGTLTGSYCIIYGNEEKAEIDKKEWKVLPITELINAKTSSSGLGAADATRVSVISAYAVPSQGAKLKFKMPPFIGCWIYAGHNSSGAAISFSNSHGWFHNGDEFTFAESDIYFRFVFAYRNHIPFQAGDTSYNISVSDIEGLIDSGELAIFYNGEEDIVFANTDCEKYVRAATRKFTNNHSADGDLDVFPKFVHTSDIHGDIIRTNRFVKYADFIGADAALISGDMVAYRGFDRMNFVNSIADKHNTPVYICMGNHDNGKFGDFATEQAQYENIMKYLIDKNECATPAGVSYPTYYYKDFPAKKIRLITLNSYEAGRDVSNSSNCLYSQTQIDWFIATLASTPQDYGVVLMYHSPESDIAKDINRSAFYQNSQLVDTQSDSITGGPIVKIIDAFITKSAISDSFTEKDSNNTTITISYSADFSHIASGVEFIAHICGHEHSDFIGYYANADSRQLVLNVTCGICLYGTNYLNLAHLSDLPRGGVGVTQDSFNFYAIDRARGIVKVARVGSNTNYDGMQRMFAIMPYKD